MHYLLGVYSHDDSPTWLSCGGMLWRGGGASGWYARVAVEGYPSDLISPDAWRVAHGFDPLGRQVAAEGAVRPRPRLADLPHRALPPLEPPERLALGARVEGAVPPSRPSPALGSRAATGRRRRSPPSGSETSRRRTSAHRRSCPSARPSPPTATAGARRRARRPRRTAERRGSRAAVAHLGVHRVIVGGGADPAGGDPRSADAGEPSAPPPRVAHHVPPGRRPRAAPPPPPPAGARGARQRRLQRRARRHREPPVLQRLGRRQPRRGSGWSRARTKARSSVETLVHTSSVSPGGAAVTAAAASGAPESRRWQTQPTDHMSARSVAAALGQRPRGSPPPPPPPRARTSGATPRRAARRRGGRPRRGRARGRGRTA